MVVSKDWRRTGPGEYTGQDLPLMGAFTAKLGRDGNLSVSVAGALGPVKFALIPIRMDNPRRFERAKAGKRDRRPPPRQEDYYEEEQDYYEEESDYYQEEEYSEEGGYEEEYTEEDYEYVEDEEYYEDGEEYTEDDEAYYEEELSLTTVSVLASGTVVYGIDGTGKSFDKNDRTNVYHFMMAHRAANPGSHYEYAGGVGSRLGNNFNPLNWPGKLTGAGGKKIINKMYDKLVDHFKAGRKEIVLVGFSRGAALSREFAQLIQKRGDPLKYRKGKKPSGKAPKIKFMALFDTVYSFGLGAGKHDLGFTKAITSDVQAVAHATAKWERRNTFDLWSIHFDKKYLNKSTGSVKSGNLRAEKGFCAGHDDVGGALDKNYLGYAPLKWVISEARKAGLKVATPKARLFKKGVPQPEVSIKDGRCQENQVADVKGKGKRQIYFPKREKIKATVHKKAKNGCKGKQLYLSKGACYSCPTGYKRFSPTRKMTHPEACTERGVGFGKQKTKATYRWQANGCPKNQFKHQGMCKSCPTGTKRQHIAGMDSGYCK